MMHMVRLSPRSVAITLLVLSLTFAFVVNSGLLSGSVASGAQTVPEERSGLAPLSRTEADRARQAARASERVGRRPAAARPLEELMVELVIEDKEVYARGNAPRRAEVLYYDYEADSTVRVVVDVRSGKVERSENVPGMQPLISADERQRALAIALADARVGAAIRAQYRAATGAELTGANQLVVDAGVFSGDSMPDVAAVQLCAKRHRCAGLLLSTAQGKLINASPVIDLSNGKALHVVQ